MKPGGGGKPSGELLALLERDFTSYEKFYEEFNAAAATQFGAGWAWLACKCFKCLRALDKYINFFLTLISMLSDSNEKLKVVKTPNAVNPLVLGSFVSFSLRNLNTQFT